jgi:biopolymer transport protein ExbB/TolQ
MFGLLGTIISLALATAQFGGGGKLTSEVILRVIPLTGQALVSTVFGLLIALVTETALHFLERKEAKDANHS